jgi:hypothetical protein
MRTFQCKKTGSVGRRDGVVREGLGNSVDGRREHWALFDAAPITSALATRHEFRSRARIEEKHRQLKCFPDLAKFTSRALFFGGQVETNESAHPPPARSFPRCTSLCLNCRNICGSIRGLDLSGQMARIAGAKARESLSALASGERPPSIKAGENVQLSGLGSCRRSDIHLSHNECVCSRIKENIARAFDTPPTALEGAIRPSAGWAKEFGGSRNLSDGYRRSWDSSSAASG